MTVAVTQGPRHSIDRRRWRWLVGRRLQVVRLTYTHVLWVTHALSDKPGPYQALSGQVLGLVTSLCKVLKVHQLMLTPRALLALL